jgi:hypothetical protein
MAPGEAPAVCTARRHLHSQERREGGGVAQSGNGADLGAVYQLLSEVAQTVRSHSDEFGHIHRDLGDLRRTVEDLGASVSDLRASITITMRPSSGTASSPANWSSGSGGSDAT